jgi:hypothetical protein
MQLITVEAGQALPAIGVTLLTGLLLSDLDIRSRRGIIAIGDWTGASPYAPAFQRRALFGSDKLSRC